MYVVKDFEGVTNQKEKKNQIPRDVACRAKRLGARHPSDHLDNKTSASLVLFYDTGRNRSHSQIRNGCTNVIPLSFSPFFLLSLLFCPQFKIFATILLVERYPFDKKKKKEKNSLLDYHIRNLSIFNALFKILGGGDLYRDV